MAKKTTPFTTTKKFAGQVKDIFGLNAGSFGIRKTANQAVTGFKDSAKSSLKVILFLCIIGFLIIGGIFSFIFAIIFITNSSGFVTPHAPSLISFFDPGGGFSDPTSCPLIGGSITLGSYDPTNENNRAGGHGSSYYWNSVYSGNCYSTPQRTGCRSSSPPDGNRCNNPTSGSSCTEYGFSADVFSGDPSVVLPLVDGQPRDWSCSYGFANGSVGHTVDCTTTSGSPSVRLVLTHVIAAPGFSASGPSGTIITNLYDQGGNTHLHLEAQVDGAWVRPENYFCGGGI